MRYVVLSALVVLAGCAAATGFAVGRETAGSQAYICDETPTADSYGELGEMLAGELESERDRTDERVEVEVRRRIKVDGEMVDVGKVVSDDLRWPSTRYPQRYWVKLTSVCYEK